MVEYIAGDYGTAVIGAGHAGIEAALASARLGVKTVLFTLVLDAIGNMPCNPSIGGTAKGHLVREIDALGGEMGIAADHTFLQSRMLNRGKGPAVHSLRVQADRKKYHAYMKKVLEEQENLEVKQAEIIEIRKGEDGQVKQVVTKLGAVYNVQAAIICSGTYLNGKIFVGDASYESGPDGTCAAKGLTASLHALGIQTRRFKTGTPPRAHSRSIDFSVLEKQEGEEPIIPFSFASDFPMENKVCCYIAYTNEKTHQVILDNLHRSPLYGGKIEGIGPRYCPSIEDKVVRFKDKSRHQVFVEPMGLDTCEIYLQGLSSSLPEDVQLAFLRTIKGFENIEIMRNAYAIEYDCCNPLDLKPTLEFKALPGLFGAGQFNGTSGYEEAAAQGLVAGINAAAKVLGREALVLDRASSYIGTLIDDLVTKGCADPYRMMTSRSEYRLILRQDNADARLTPTGYKIGLISRQRYEKLQNKLACIQQQLARLSKKVIAPGEEINRILEQKGTPPLTTGAKFSDLVRRPQIRLADLLDFDQELQSLPPEILEEVEIEIKYEGYIKRQLQQVEQMRKLEEKAFPQGMDFHQVSGLRLEAVEKLAKIAPENIGQASRISGVSPADISVLLIWLGAYNKGNTEEK